MVLLFPLAGYAGSYTNHGNGTVTDLESGLMWQQEDDGTQRTWEEALDYCYSLPLGGYSDWRLPNIKELQSLVDYSKVQPAIDLKFFVATKQSNYWSSTTFPDNPTYAYNVNFYFGNYVNVEKLKNDSSYVRCVR